MMFKYTRYWLTTVPASEGVDAHTAGQIRDFGQTGEEGMMWFEGHGPSEGYGTIEGEFSDEFYRIDLKTLQPVKLPPAPPEVPTPAQIRRTAMRADVAGLALRRKLAAASPQEIDDYVDQNVSNLADVKTMLKRMLRLIAADAPDR